MWITRKKLKAQNAALEAALETLKADCALLEAAYKAKVEVLEEMYPFSMGQIVYNVNLRSATGRFTKTKVSKEHSYVDEVVVNKTNYFKLVDRYANKDVFMTLKAAEDFIASIAVE